MVSFYGEIVINIIFVCKNHTHLCNYLQTERLAILNALATKVHLASDVQLQHFADTCQDFTGADFKVNC